MARCLGSSAGAAMTRDCDITCECERACARGAGPGWGLCCCWCWGWYWGWGWGAGSRGRLRWRGWLSSSGSTSVGYTTFGRETEKERKWWFPGRKEEEEEDVVVMDEAGDMGIGTPPADMRCPPFTEESRVALDSVVVVDAYSQWSEGGSSSTTIV